MELYQDPLFHLSRGLLLDLVAVLKFGCDLWYTKNIANALRRWLIEGILGLEQISLKNIPSMSLWRIFKAKKIVAKRSFLSVKIEKTIGQGVFSTRSIIFDLPCVCSFSLLCFFTKTTKIKKLSGDHVVLSLRHLVEAIHSLFQLYLTSSIFAFSAIQFSVRTRCPIYSLTANT